MQKEVLSVEALFQILQDKLESWVRMTVSILPNLVVALLIFLIFLWWGRLVKQLLGRILGQLSHNPALNSLITSVVQLLITMIGLFISLGILNLDKTVTSLLTGAGIVTLALGFAFQDIASNFFSGVMIAFRKPYRVGDLIEINKVTGTVRSIELRTTILKIGEGSDVFIPNKNMVTDVLTNFSTTPDRRLVMTYGVAYGSDLNKVIQVTEEALQDLAGRMPNKPVQCRFLDFTPHAINTEVGVWIDSYRQTDFGSARHEAILKIDAAYRKAGIEIPAPLQTVRLEKSESVP